MTRTTIGILGGMGPLATIDFMQKIMSQTPAQRDQDHLPLLVYSIPQIPDRTACLIDNRDSPLDELKKGVRTLTEAGAGCIVIPCNTAHFWYGDLVGTTHVPILHIAQACAGALSREGVPSVALLATDGTLKAGIYSNCLDSYGIGLEIPEPSLQRMAMEGIYRVKSGDVRKGGEILEYCLKAMLASGVERVILGCTEIPLALDRINSEYRAYCLDATHVLAAACVQWYQSRVRGRDREGADTCTP